MRLYVLIAIFTLLIVASVSARKHNREHENKKHSQFAHYYGQTKNDKHASESFA